MPSDDAEDHGHVDVPMPTLAELRDAVAEPASTWTPRTRKERPRENPRVAMRRFERALERELAESLGGKMLDSEEGARDPLATEEEVRALCAHHRITWEQIPWWWRGWCSLAEMESEIRERGLDAILADVRRARRDAGP